MYNLAYWRANAESRYAATVWVFGCERRPCTDCWDEAMCQAWQLMGLR